MDTQKHQIATSQDLQGMQVQGTNPKFRLSMEITINPRLVYLFLKTVVLSIHRQTIKTQIENSPIIWIPAIIEGT